MEPNGIVSEIRVLVVDDNEDIRQSIGTILSENGCRCESAKNGVEAIQIARRSSLDAVVTDLKMPEMDGIDLTKELSRLFFDVPVMIITGHSDGGSREIALRAGAREFLTKPFPASDLITGLHRMFLRCNPFKEHEFQN